MSFAADMPGKSFKFLFAFVWNLILSNQFNLQLFSHKGSKIHICKSWKGVYSLFEPKSRRRLGRGSSCSIVTE